MRVPAEMLLPPDLREVACRSGNEWGWPPELIPKVIDEAERLHLLSLGGQLQFLLRPGTCECYWVEVDTHKSVPANLPWDERVARTAAAARSQFEELQTRYDFIAEGRSAFARHLDEFEANGGNVKDAMCFIWYLEAEESTSKQP